MTQTRYQLRRADGTRSIDFADTLVAGRSADCDLVLTEGTPSRRHAQLTVRTDGVWIEDLGSTNGTFVNGEEVVDAVRIRNGDRVSFHTEEYLFIVESDADADPNATVVVRRERQPPTAVATHSETYAPTQASTAEAPAGEPPTGARSEDVVPGQRGAHRPGSWADPEHHNAQGTRLFNPDELRQLGAGGGDGSLDAVDAPYLHVTTGVHAGRNLMLTPGSGDNAWEIGSDEGREIAFSDEGVSGLHARLTNDGMRWKLIDQLSANGTYVNGKKSNVSYLGDGDRIRFGPVECIFRVPTGSVRPASGEPERMPASSRRRALLIGAVSFAATIAVLAAILLLLD